MSTHLVGRAWPSLALGVIAAISSAASTSDPPGIEEVRITAPEPKYVAPTLRDRIGRIWAPVMIDGQGPLRLVLDTGASSAALTFRAAERLSLDADRSRKVTLRGTTGSAVAPTVRLRTLEVGDFLSERPRIVLVEDAFGGADGVLPARLLKDRRIHVEFRKDRIEITRSRNQPPPPGYLGIPVRFAPYSVPWIEAYVGTVRVRAVIDTGAQQTIGNLALRDALEQARRRAPPSSDEEIIGVTGDIQIGQSARAPTIQLGRVRVRNARINYVDLHIFGYWRMRDEPTLLVGMDVLGVVDTFILDYRRRELQIKTN